MAKNDQEYLKVNHKYNEAQATLLELKNHLYFQQDSKGKTLIKKFTAELESYIQEVSVYHAEKEALVYKQAYADGFGFTLDTDNNVPS